LQLFKSLQTDGACLSSFVRGYCHYPSYLQCFLEIKFFLGQVGMKSKAGRY